MGGWLVLTACFCVNFVLPLGLGDFFKMTDVKDSRTLHTEDVNSSDGDIVEKGSIVGKHGGGHAESLNDLDDPDAGKSPEERAALDKQLVRKTDRWLIPWLCLLYLLSFLDRTNIGNARLAGM